MEFVVHEGVAGPFDAALDAGMVGDDALALPRRQWVVDRASVHCFALAHADTVSLLRSAKAPMPAATREEDSAADPVATTAFRPLATVLTDVTTVRAAFAAVLSAECATDPTFTQSAACRVLYLRRSSGTVCGSGSGLPAHDEFTTIESVDRMRSKSAKGDAMEQRVCLQTLLDAALEAVELDIFQVHAAAATAPPVVVAGDLDAADPSDRQLNRDRVLTAEEAEAIAEQRQKYVAEAVQVAAVEVH